MKTNKQSRKKTLRNSEECPQHARKSSVVAQSKDVKSTISWRRRRGIIVFHSAPLPSPNKYLLLEQSVLQSAFNSLPSHYYRDISILR